MFGFKAKVGKKEIVKTIAATMAVGGKQLVSPTQEVSCFFTI